MDRHEACTFRIRKFAECMKCTRPDLLKGLYEREADKSVFFVLSETHPAHGRWDHIFPDLYGRLPAPCCRPMVGIESGISVHLKKHELHFMDFMDAFPILPDVLGSLLFCSRAFSLAIDFFCSRAFSLAIDQLIFRLGGKLLPSRLCFSLCCFKRFSKLLCFQYSLGDLPLSTLLSRCRPHFPASGKAGCGY